MVGFVFFLLASWLSYSFPPPPPPPPRYCCCCWLVLLKLCSTDTAASPTDHFLLTQTDNFSPLFYSTCNTFQFYPWPLTFVFLVCYLQFPSYSLIPRPPYIPSGLFSGRYHAIIIIIVLIWSPSFFPFGMYMRKLTVAANCKINAKCMPESIYSIVTVLL